MTKIIADSGGSTQRILPPEGTHAARCFSVVHTGTQKPMKEGFKPKDVVRVSWELPDEKAVFKEGEPEKPFVVSKQYNRSLNEKATLRKDLEGWRGKQFTPEELKGFDVSKLIGVPCMVSIIHKKADNGNTYANVTSVSSVPKSMNVPELTNEKLVFSVLDFKQDVYDTFPDFIQNEIMSSRDMQERGTTTDTESPKEEPAGGDDLPF